MADQFADVIRITKDTRAEFTGAALKVGQSGRCLNTDDPTKGHEHVHRNADGSYSFYKLVDWLEKGDYYTESEVDAIIDAVESKGADGAIQASAGDGSFKDSGITISPTVAEFPVPVIIPDATDPTHSATLGQVNAAVASAIVQTITDGDTTHSTSSDVLYDALIEKVTVKTITLTAPSGLTVGNWYTVATFVSSSTATIDLSISISDTTNGRIVGRIIGPVGIYDQTDALQLISDNGTTGKLFNEVRIVRTTQTGTNYLQVKAAKTSGTGTAYYLSFKGDSTVYTSSPYTVTGVNWVVDDGTHTYTKASINLATGTIASLKRPNAFAGVQTSDATNTQITVAGNTAMPTVDWTNTALALKANLSGATFTGAISVNSTAEFGVTGKTKIESTGHQVLTGDATVWEDANFDPTMLTGGGTLPARINFASTGMSVSAFSGSQTDEISATVEIPHCAKLNSVGSSTVKGSFHAHIYPTDTAGGNARFGLEYLFTKEGVAVTTSTTLLTTVTLSTTAWAKQTFNFADITMPEELGSQMHWRFYRLGADPLDTATADVACATVGLHYEIDSVGSREQLIK